jgi:hypothetical protein
MRILAKFHHDLPRHFEYKVSDSELRFPLVTHIAYSDARFGSYGILKSG